MNALKSQVFIDSNLVKVGFSFTCNKIPWFICSSNYNFKYTSNRLKNIVKMFYFNLKIINPISPYTEFLKSDGNNSLTSRVLESCWFSWEFSVMNQMHFNSCSIHIDGISTNVSAHDLSALLCSFPTHVKLISRFKSVTQILYRNKWSLIPILRSNFL